MTRSTGRPPSTGQLRDAVARIVRLRGARVALFFALALTIRLQHFDRLGFSHWDETFFVNQARAFAFSLGAWTGQLHWAGTPGLGVLLGLAAKFLGPSNQVMFFVAACLGASAVAATYILTARLLGEEAATGAALLAAVSPFPVMFSRLVLADSAFAAVLLISCAVLYEFLEQPATKSSLRLGLAIGALILMKYTGVYMIGLLWLNVLETLFHRTAARRTLVQGATLATVAGVTIGMSPIAFVIAVRDEVTLGSLWTYFGHFTVIDSQPWSERLVTPLQILMTWTSGPVLVAALAGIIFGLRQRSRPVIFVAISAASYAALLPGYTAFPRLALPLFFFVFPLAGYACAEVSRRVAGAVLPVRPLRAATTFVFVLAIGGLAATTVAETLDVLSRRYTGYADAAEYVRTAGEGRPVVVFTQPVFGLYMNSGIGLGCSPEIADTVRSQRDVLVVLDHIWTRWRWSREFMELNRHRLRELRDIRFEPQDEVLLQPARLRDLSMLRHGTLDRSLHLRIYASQGPLVMPPSCSIPSSGS